jgi:DNA-binding NarL/FixJ family response regulator
MIRILIADDHTIVRKGIRQIISEEFPDAAIDEVPDTESLIQAAIRQEWDLIITDISMPGRSGLEALGQIRQINQHLPILIMSIHSEDQYAIRSLKAGASGYLNKDLAPDELILAIRTVISGKKYISSSVAEKLASMLESNENKPAHHCLSDREMTVFTLLSKGKSLTEIGQQLSISVNTVSTYRSRILLKMNFTNNAEIVLYAMEHKIQ